MEDIVLNGVSINELKATKAKLQKAATEFISDGIQEATELVEAAVVAVDKKEVEALAKQAIEKLEAVQVVSGVSGVDYYLPYSTEWGYDETPLSVKLETATEDDEDESRNSFFSVYGDGPVGQLFDLLENMEYQSKSWHQSTC